MLFVLTLDECQVSCAALSNKPTFVNLDTQLEGNTTSMNIDFGAECSGSDYDTDESTDPLGPLRLMVRADLDDLAGTLLNLGPPGTGKTRLVRAILAAISRRKGASAKVLYTADRRALESDRIFLQFITGEHDAFVIEDADHILMSRSSGNEDMHRFLAVADSVVRAQGRKILFTTNLPNVHDIDEALLRPGRCLGNVRTRALNRTEAARLVGRLCGGAGDVPGRRTRSNSKLRRPRNAKRRCSVSTQRDFGNAAPSGSRTFRISQPCLDLFVSL